MDATLDFLEWLMTSPAAWLVAVAMMAGVLAWQSVQVVRRELAIHQFLRRHGFRTTTESTMWLARQVERWSALSSYGYWEGMPVTVERPRRGGLTITVTAEGNLVAAPSEGRVSLGAWTRPAPPALLAGAPLEAEGRLLRLRTGEVLDLAPCLTAAVEYTRALALNPVDR